MARPTVARLLSPALAFLLHGSLAAQTRESPNLVLTISAGLTTAGSLWAVGRQDYPVPPDQVDSFALGRRLRPGIVAAVGASFFRGPRLGYWLELGYFGLATESRCSPLGPYASDPDQTTRQACERIQGAHVLSSAVGLQPGLIYRLAPGSTVSPYLRVSGGVAILGSSFVQTEAVVTSDQCDPGPSCLLALLQEGKRKDFALIGTLAGGFTITTSPGYRIRLELRDVVAGLPTVRASAPLTPGQPRPADVSTTVHHVITVTAGLDVVLERRHPRRY